MEYCDKIGIIPSLFFYFIIVICFLSFKASKIIIMIINRPFN